MEIKDFSDVFGKNPDFELPILQENFLNREFVIIAVRFGKRIFGEKKEYAVVTIDKKEYRTGSSVLCEQLHGILEVYEKESNDDRIRVTLYKVKNYFTFINPD